MDLKLLIIKVAEALGDSTDFVEISFGSINGEFCWWCRVHPKRKKHGRGQQVVRAGFYADGDSPEEVVNSMLEKISIFKDPNTYHGRGMRETLDEMLEAGALSPEEHKRAVAKLEKNE